MVGKGRPRRMGGQEGGWRSATGKVDDDVDICIVSVVLAGRLRGQAALQDQAAGNYAD